MKTKVLTPETATTETSLEQAVKTAIKNAPSRAALEAEKEKLVKVAAARQVAARNVNQLIEQLAKFRIEASDSKVKRILSGGNADDKLAAKLGDAQRNLAAIDEALQEQRSNVLVLHGKFSAEVNRAVRTSRAPSVSRIAAALVELKAACDAEIEARSAIAGAGVDVHALDSFGYLPVLGEEAWFEARRKQGFTV